MFDGVACNILYDDLWGQDNGHLKKFPATHWRALNILFMRLPVNSLRISIVEERLKFSILWRIFLRI